MQQPSTERRCWRGRAGAWSSRRPAHSGAHAPAGGCATCTEPAPIRLRPLPARDAGRPARAPAGRGPSPRPPAGGWRCAAGGQRGRAAMSPGCTCVLNPSEPTPASESTSASSALVRCPSNRKISRRPKKGLVSVVFSDAPARRTAPSEALYWGQGRLAVRPPDPLESAFYPSSSALQQISFSYPRLQPLCLLQPPSLSSALYAYCRTGGLTFATWKRAEIHGTFAGPRAIPKARTCHQTEPPLIGR